MPSSLMHIYLIEAVSGVTGVTIGNMNPSLIGRGGRILGSMATVGRNRAVAELSKVQMQGWLA